ERPTDGGRERQAHRGVPPHRLPLHRGLAHRRSVQWLRSLAWPTYCDGVIVSVLLAAALVAFVLVDAVLGRWHRTGTVAPLHVTPARSGTARQALLAFPGYTMPGGVLSAAFAPNLGADDAMIVVEYAQRGMDPDAIHRAVMAELAALGAPSLRVYGGSMGGMC